MNMSQHSTTPDVTLVTQLPSDSWFEGFTTLPNDHILAACLDAPELYELDPKNNDTEPRLVCTFDGAAAALNICPVPGRPYEFTVMTCGVSNRSSAVWEGFTVWHLTLDPKGKTPPTTKRVGDAKDVGLPLGLAPVNQDFILVADSADSCLRYLDIRTGQSSVLLKDPASMNVQRADSFFGINRMVVQEGYIWYSNYSSGNIYRVPCESADDSTSSSAGPLKITGAVQLVVDDLDFCNGFQIQPGGGAAYTVNYMEGTVVRTPLKDGKQLDKSKAVVRNLVSPTAAEFGGMEDGKRKLYVICCGEIDVGWLNDSVSWKDIASIQATETVTVITEG